MFATSAISVQTHFDAHFPFVSPHANNHMFTSVSDFPGDRRLDNRLSLLSSEDLNLLESHCWDDLAVETHSERMII